MNWEPFIICINTSKFERFQLCAGSEFLKKMVWILEATPKSCNMFLFIVKEDSSEIYAATDSFKYVEDLDTFYFCDKRSVVVDFENKSMNAFWEIFQETTGLGLIFWVLFVDMLRKIYWIKERFLVVDSFWLILKHALIRKKLLWWEVANVWRFFWFFDKLKNFILV